MARHVWIACFLLLFGSFPAAADCKAIPIEGVWSAGRPTQLPGIPFCQIKYTCGPAQTGMNDASCKMEADSETVRGACSAGSGPVNSCNSCLAAAPSKTCHYKWVKR
jgi:hypothetical protein